MSSLFATRADLFAVGRTGLVGTPNAALNPAVYDVPGSDLNLVGGIASVMGEEISARAAVAARGCFAELARSSQLDRVIYDRSGLARFSATPATIDLVLTRPTPGGAHPGTYLAGSVVQDALGNQFATDVDSVFGNYDTTELVSATALVAGVAGNSPAGTVTAFSTQPFDSTITVTNPASAAGGTEAESDITFLGRYRGYFPTLRRAVLAAIEYAAKQVDGVAVATAVEIVNPTSGFPAAIVQLTISDSNGNSTSDMITAVANELLDYRAAGMPVVVEGGTVAYQSVTWQLAFLTGFDETLIESRVRAITVAVAQFLPPGPANGILYRSALLGACKQVPGVVLGDASLMMPVGDVVPSVVSQMIRIRSTDVSFI